MHRTTRRWVTGAAVLSAGVLTLGPVTSVFAQSDDPGGSTTTTPSTPATPATPKALPDWMKSVLDSLVKAGTITQAQADAVTKAIQDARPAMDRRGPGGGDRHGGFGRIGIALDAAAKALGIDLDELKTELQSGKTLAEIATAHKIDIQKVIDALTADAKAKLDEAVKNGRITQEQADSRLSEMTSRLQDLVNQPLPGPGGPWHRGGHGKDDGTKSDDGSKSTTPSTTAPSTTAPSTTSPGGS
jgi:polyhydroxyalkanoate synthesis regulator phasin